MPNKDTHKDIQTRNFFETHGSAEIVTASDIIPEMREEAAKRFDLILKQSPVLQQALNIKGLTDHYRSMRALSTSAYYIRCKGCENIPVVNEVVVFHPHGRERFFKDGTHISAPPPNVWPVEDGFHFILGYSCTHCLESDSTIATFTRQAGLLLQEYVKWTNSPKDGSTSTEGFIVKQSWIKTYFEKKKIDLSYAQKVASACIKCYRELKRTCKKRQLSGPLFDTEVIGGILDVIRNFIPPIESERQFCGLIKGVYFFTLVYYQDKEYNLRTLDSASNLPFSLHELKKEFKGTAQKLTYDEKKNLLASAILYVENAYQSLSLLPMPVPDWVDLFRGLVSSLHKSN